MIRLATHRTAAPLVRRWDGAIRRVRGFAHAGVARRAMNARRETLPLVRARHGWASRLSVTLNAQLHATFTTAFPMTVVRIRTRPAMGSQTPTMPGTVAPGVRSASLRGAVAPTAPSVPQRSMPRAKRDAVAAPVVSRSRIVRVPAAPPRSTPLTARGSRPRSRPSVHMVMRVRGDHVGVRPTAQAPRAHPVVRPGAANRSVRTVAVRLPVRAGSASAVAGAKERDGDIALESRRGAGAARLAPARLPMEVVRRGRTTNPATRTPAFSASALPLLAQAHPTSAAPEFPMERIERTLRESLTSVTERTVQREVERTLRAGAPIARRLRESIQAEIYDDIVLERERRGGGGR